MKSFVCEMCGGTDLVKQDGFFVCQHCGTKYSLEEAKKLMVEGHVDVSGSTIKVDTSEELTNLYQIARRAKDDNNYKNAAKYYEMILVKDPTSWEATFYTVYCQAMECRIADIRNAAISISNCEDTVLKLIKEHIEDKAEQITALIDVTVRCNSISSLLFKAARDHYKGIDEQIRNKYTQEMIDRCFAAKNICYYLGNYIVHFFSEYPEHQTLSVEAWKNGVREHSILIQHLKNKEENKKTINKYVEKIQKYDSSYTPPKIPTSSGSCYIATAVYGSYDCPQVWTLRRYRDFVLAKTWYGRLFIKTYYLISPSVVKHFGHIVWIRNIWKKPLDRMVMNLNKQGINDAPYDDQSR